MRAALLVLGLCIASPTLAADSFEKGGRLRSVSLGTWQSLCLVEHRDRPHQRELMLSAVGA